MSDDELSPLARKLNLRAGMRVRVDGLPSELSLDLDGVAVVEGTSDVDGLVAFAIEDADVDRAAADVVALAKADRISWIAYPKAKQLGTTLTRDTLRFRFADEGVHAIRQVSIDDTWSAVRYRPM